MRRYWSRDDCNMALKLLLSEISYVLLFYDALALVGTGPWYCVYKLLNIGFALQTYVPYDQEAQRAKCGGTLH